MDQVSIKYTNIFRCKALQNLPKFGFFGLKTNHLATLVRALVRSNVPWYTFANVGIKYLTQKWKYVLC
jgi:hypothetical protein